MPYGYPTTDLDRPRLLLALAGGFWSKFYPDFDLLLRYGLGLGLLAQNALQPVREAQAAAGRLTTPSTRLVPWGQLALDAAAQQPYLQLIGEAGLTVGGGQRVGDVDPCRWAWALPDGLRDLPVLLGSLGTPDRDRPGAAAVETVCWLRGFDFVADQQRGQLVFTENPLADARLTRQLDAAGAVARAFLWPCRAAYDTTLAYDRYGLPLGFATTPGAAYVALVNAAWDALVEGAPRGAYRRALSAVTGTAFGSAGETVELLARDRRGLLIATDRNVYRYAAAAAPRVAVGDVLAAGQELVDSVRVFEFANGAAPAAADLDRVTIPARCLLGDYGDLTFTNADTALVVTTDGGGNTQVSFALGGDAAGVARFWADVHARGLAAGRTLAQYLDLRPDPVGQPTAASLPATINPLAFAAQNLLRNTLVVQIRQDHVPDDPEAALGLGWQWALDRCLPLGITALYDLR